jgi:flagellar biosynthesis GTPase FlhF
MRLKSYFSATVEAAMERARQELGEDALLVSARPSTPETRHLGAYEVVFGIPPRQAQAAVPAAAPMEERAGPANDRPPQDVAGLKGEFERMLRSLGETHSSAATAQQLSPLGQEIQEARPALPHYEVDATVGCPGAVRAIVALVGPPGVGKTTTLIKLAARYGLTARKPTRILSADVFRIAAADQLRSLASILGIGCDVAETAGALAQLLEEHRSKDLLFVDTPGLAPADMQDAADLAALLKSHPEVDTHLVLPAFMRASDMARAVQQFAVFGPRKLLFTRVDETTCHEDLVWVAAQHGLPISFLGTGQQVPDDLEPAQRARIDALAGLAPKSISLHSITKGAAA